MLEEKNIKNLKITVSFLFLTYLVLKIESKTIIDSTYPFSLTLYNENILLITKQNIIFYDNSFNSIIKMYNLSESEMAQNIIGTYKTMACQYPIEHYSYILVFVMDQLYFFDQYGNKLQKQNFTIEFSSQNYYEIIPIKSLLNELYYIISLTTKESPFAIKLFYYKMNINTGENKLIEEKVYTPLNIYGKAIISISDNAPCLLMNSKEINNILTCIYSVQYPCQISILSFSLENDNITELSSYSTKIEFNEQQYINYFRVKTIENKSKAYFVFVIYQAKGYSGIYDINLNNISKIEERINNIGSSSRCSNIYYFQRTSQFILLFRDNDKTFYIVAMNKTYDVIYNKNGSININYDGYTGFSTASIVYLKNELRYYILSDANKFGVPNGIKIFPFNITFNITNNYIDYDSDSNEVNSYSIQEEEKKEEENKEEEKKKEENKEEENKEEKKEEEKKEEENKEEKKEEEKKEEEKKEEEKKEEENKEEEKKEEEKKEEESKDEQNKEEENKQTQKYEYEEDKKEKEIEIDKIIINNKVNKCYSYSEESLKMNLCIECNIGSGFYPVNYKDKNIYPKRFKECFSDKTKLINFFFNKEKKEYEPCFETCNTCNYGGNEEVNNCTSCDVDSIFRPETNSTTNCVKKCKYKYYYTSYGHYKCSENDYCPNEAKLYINSKNKCIEDCKLDDIYKYQYNGECFDKCPNGTIEENNICVNIKNNKCSYRENIDYLKSKISNEDINILAKKYSTEYMYTNNHISIYKNDLYFIALYKNKDCINELSLTIPKIDFGSCYQDIQSNNFIDSDLITLIIERYYNGSSIVLYKFYNPINGDQIDVSNVCKNVTITVEKDIIAILQGTEANIEVILQLANQNINVFDKYSEFYNDICFNYESPNKKDIPLKDRLVEFFPNITLCDDGCLFIGVNLTSMSSICQCKFSDFIGDNYFTHNAFISKLSDEIGEIVLDSNLLILQCYKNVFNYQYFVKNTGGFIILSIIICQILTTFFFYSINLGKISKYIFTLMQSYLSYINDIHFIKDKGNIISFLKDIKTPPKKNKGQPINKNNHSKKNKTILLQNNTNYINLNIKKLEIKKKSQKKLNKRSHKNFQSLKLNSLSKFKLQNNKFNNSSKNVELKDKLNNYMKEYLSTDVNDIDYDDAISLEKRTFFQYLWEKIKSAQFILDIILVKELLKPRPIKILLFLIKIDLFFFTNALFINEDYISEIYHSTEQSFFSFIKRINNNLFYISTVGAVSSYLINCFFFDENKIKHIFIREKDNEFNINKEIYLFIRNIKSGYLSFFIISYIITIFSWYVISCFNNVYPNTRREWIISSIFIFLCFQIFYLFLALFETILRFLSFKLKSEKLFKISQIFN